VRRPTAVPPPPGAPRNTRPRRTDRQHRIKKAYRKRALELHPDRNLNDTDNATRKFAEVQTAYEVLSDPQERAWYDSHRAAILRGVTDIHDDGPSEHYNVRITTTEELFTLMGKFNSSVPMNDSPSGFFGILETTFAQLAAEEQAACQWEGLDYQPFAPFGSAGDAFDSVAKPFYASWSGFSTKKSFGWKEKYRLADAPERRVRRLMEKENKKLRDDAIRDFNDTVRSLVAFVRKRDPRYVANTQSEAERQKVLRDSAAAQAARSRAANQEKLGEYVVPEWAQSRGVPGEQLSEFSASEDESEVEHIECVVCGKTFKSENQFEAHEKSKKHVKAVQQLRRQMQRENATLDLDAESSREKPQEGEAAVGRPLETGSGSPNPGVADLPPEGTVEPTEADTLSTSSAGDGSGDYVSREVATARLGPGRRLEKTVDASVDETPSLPARMEGPGEPEPPPEPPTGKKVGKARLKREKKAARLEAEMEASSQVGIKPPNS